MQQLCLVEENVKRSFLDELVAFDEFGSRTLMDEREGVPYFINEFWTSKQRQAHRLHEVSYRACFKPQLPKFFIERLTRPGDIVYDPFMGRGTTPLEAAFLGRVPYGNDTNPLSRAFVEPRISPPTMVQVLQRLDEIPWEDFSSFTEEDLLAFYHPSTLAGLEGLKGWLLKRQKEGVFDKVDAWIRMVAINRLTGHSSGFFSVYTLPPNQAVSVERQRAINEKRSQVPPLRDIKNIIIKKSKTLLSDGVPPVSNGMLLTAQSDLTRMIEDETVMLTVTSPPFLDIVNYEADNWLRCWFLGVDPKEVRISTHRSVEDWTHFVGGTLKELARITKKGGHIAFEVGEVRNGSIRLEENVIKAAKGLPFEVLAVMINQQEFTKTSNCWGVKNNRRGTNSNRIVIFRKANQ
ncbi:site-specific DNA-methyltransferase [Aliiroseovarius crassostreae]|uniref:site-specific DNA-methyltransferase n=1 Tax=Aliiroseovarius crassostreae TaxID=154981 RepID=UPI0021FBC38B|nr:site-specific DNA-methyltransferase [Aliiroseovarius crassostreae]UWP89371.1 site-specific DNA-methyltransferase [Aliiroseovarius crassostreae]